MKKIVRIVFLSLFGMFVSLSVFAQSAEKEQKSVYTEIQNRLLITQEDIRIVPEKNLPSGGYHLYIRKRPEIESVMLTETTKDPEGKNDSFSYRAKEYNSINGDEIRYLNGKPLVSEWAKYSLIDSSPEPYKAFGEAFHIYIPQTLVYGYEWERHGEIEIGKGTFINIRTFTKKFADYTGDYMDSPFMFDFLPRSKKETPSAAVPVLTDKYNPVASSKFEEISEKMIYSKGPESIIDDIMEILEDLDEKGQNDLLFCIDATGSMKDDMDKLKAELIPSLVNRFPQESDIRYGLLFYRDYTDSFRYRELPVKPYDFSTDMSLIHKNLNNLEIKGKEGGDVPEAVYEALYASVNFFSWRESSNRTVILIGDAEPHPSPRNTRKYSKETAVQELKRAHIHLKAILLPED